DCGQTISTVSANNPAASDHSLVPIRHQNSCASFPASVIGLPFALEKAQLPRFLLRMREKVGPQRYHRLVQPQPGDGLFETLMHEHRIGTLPGKARAEARIVVAAT